MFFGIGDFEDDVVEISARNSSSRLGGWRKIA